MSTTERVAALLTVLCLAGPGSAFGQRTIDIPPTTLILNYVQAVWVPATATGDPAAIFRGKLLLSRAAPASGLVVSLAIGNPAVERVGIPASTVSVPAGETSAYFSLRALPVTARTSVTISAQWGSTAARTATIDVLPPVVASITAGKGSIRGDARFGGRPYFRTQPPGCTLPCPSPEVELALSGPAPPAGSAIQLTSNHPSLAVPAWATVPTGQRMVAVPVGVHPEATPTTAVIAATLSGETKTAEFPIRPGTLPDLVILRTSFHDASGNPIATLPASGGGPFKVCAEITRAGSQQQDPGDYPTPPSETYFQFWKEGMSWGPGQHKPVDFGTVGTLTQCETALFQTMVNDLAIGQVLEIELTADVTRKVAERDENNNVVRTRIWRQ